MTLCLIVDDSEVNREIAAEVAASCGMEVMEAEDGLAALLICQERMPDLIILDWMMPEINGIEFLSLLRNMRGGDIPHVIMCSAKGDDSPFGRSKAAGKSISNGANSYMAKPYFPNSLRDSMIRAMLS